MFYPYLTLIDDIIDDKITQMLVLGWLYKISGGRVRMGREERRGVEEEGQEGNTCGGGESWSDGWRECDTQQQVGGG